MTTLPMLSKKYIKNTYDRIIRSINLLSLKRRKAVGSMFDDLGIEYFTNPASSRKDYNCCFPGGLAYHSLKVLKNYLRLMDAFDSKKYTKDTIVTMALFHDIGKIGNGNEAYYINNNDYWKSRGYLYKINEKFEKIPINHLTLYLLQKYNFDLSWDEHNVLQSLNDKNLSYRENELQMLLNFAIAMSIKEEKEEKINLLEECEGEQKENNFEQINTGDYNITNNDENDGNVSFDQAMKHVEN